MDGDDATKEQYISLMTLYDGEQGRFWTRFNISVGFQLALLIGVLSSVEFLAMNVFVFRAVLVVGAVLSAGCVAIVVRGIGIHAAILRMIAKLEEQSQGKLVLLKTYREVSGMPLAINSYICLMLGIVFCACWVCGLAYLESIGYAVTLPKK